MDGYARQHYRMKCEVKLSSLAFWAENRARKRKGATEETDGGRSGKRQKEKKTHVPLWAPASLWPRVARVAMVTG